VSNVSRTNGSQTNGFLRPVALIALTHGIGRLLGGLGFQGPPSRAIAGVSASLTTSQVITAVTAILSARWLGPSGKGLVAGATTWSQLLAFLAGMAVAVAVQVRVAEAPADTKFAAVRTALGNGLLYSAVVGTSVGLASFYPLAKAMAHLGPESTGVVAIAVLPLPLSVLAPFLANVQLALGKNRIYSISLLLGPMTTFALVVAAAAASKLSPFVLMGCYLVGGIASLVASAQSLPWRSLQTNLSILLIDIRLGVKLSLSAFMGLANARLDVLVMTIFLGSRDIGLYTAANSAMLPIVSIPAAIAVMTTSSVARLQAEDGTEGAVEAIWRSSRQSLALSLVGGGVLAVAAPVLIPALVGNAYRPSIPIIWILIAGYVARSVMAVVVAGANGMRRPRVGYGSEGIGLVVTVALLPLLLPRWGITGAAVTSSVSYCLSAAISIRWLFRARRRPIASGTQRTSDTPGMASLHDASGITNEDTP
jgi:O-antigen/teichoic acid export membrane protein